jgi:uncharacterized YccA/Bax inhibitor family protein
MTIIPEVLSIAAELTFKFQVTPLNIFMLVALGLCVALVWRYVKSKRRI